MNRSKTFGFIIIGLGGLLVVFFIFLLLRSTGVIPTPEGGGLLSLPFGNRTNVPDTIDTGTSVPGVSSVPDDSDTSSENKERVVFRVSTHPISGYGVSAQYRDVLQTVITQLEILDPVTEDLVTEDVAKDVVTRVPMPRLRYNDVATGYLYQYDVIEDKGKEEQLTDTTVPRAGEVLFAGLDQAVFRYAVAGSKAIETYRARITSTLDAVKCPYSFTERLLEGASGRAVEQVQSILATLIPSYRAVQLGVFDVSMKEAVIGFQKEHALVADGVIGRGTNALFQKLCTEQEQQDREEELQQKGGVQYRLRGAFFNDPTFEVTVSPDQKSLFSLIPGSGNNVSGVISDPDGTNARQVYQLPFSEWIIDWPTSSLITLTTKASGFIAGSLYGIDVISGHMDKIWGNQIGLTTLMNGDGSRALYSRIFEGALQFGVFDMKSYAPRGLVIMTLPEKCVWRHDGVHVICAVPEFLPEGIYPDDWYQQLVQFDDALWDINTLTGEKKLLNTLADIPGTIDAVQLQISSDESHVFFVNQIDGYLWALNLQPTE